MGSRPLEIAKNECPKILACIVCKVLLRENEHASSFGNPAKLANDHSRIGEMLYDIPECDGIVCFVWRIDFQAIAVNLILRGI